MRVESTKMVADVKEAMNQNGDSGRLLLDGDIATLELDRIIESKLCEAIRQTHLNAPTTSLDAGHNFGDELYWNGNGSGFVMLPCDFLRLVMFEMSDWARAVFSTLDATDPRYVLQRSQLKGLRGTPRRPMCVIAQRPEGRVLEFYSCRNEDATLKHAVYIPEPKIERDGTLWVSERCYGAAVELAATLTSTAMAEDTRAEVHYKLWQQMI